MMRSLSTFLNNAILRSDGPGFRPLLMIAATLYSTESLNVGSLTFSGELLSISVIDEVLQRSGDLVCELPDNASNRAAIQLLVKAVVWFWAVGDSEQGMDRLFEGFVSDPISRSGGKIRFDCVSMAARHNRTITFPLTVSDHPQANPDHIGKSVPVVYGTIESAPCLGIDSGSTTTLSADLNASSTTLTVTDNRLFPNSATVRLDDEDIAYAGRGSTNQLTGCTRGANGTTAVPHNRGASLIEKQTQYHYLITAHPLKAASEVRHQDVGVDATDYSLNLATAQLTLNRLPVLRRSANLAANDTITMSASQNTHAHTYTGAVATQTITQNAINSSYYASEPWPGYATVFISFPPVPGVGSSANVTFTISFSGSNASVGGVNIASFGTHTIGVGGDWNGLYATAIPVGNETRWISVTGAVRTMTYFPGSISISSEQPSITTLKSGGVDLEGNAVTDALVGGAVTLNVSGWADDASGSITGTPYALIERPDHIVRHLLRQYGGASNAETQESDFAAFTGETLAIHCAETRSVRDILREIDRHCRSITVYTGGRWIMRKRPSPGAAVISTVLPGHIVRKENGASTLTESLVGLSAMANRSTWRAGLRPDGTWMHSGIVNDSTSQGLYGIEDAKLDLPYISDAAQAQTIVNWLTDRSANPKRRILTLDCTLVHHALELGDVVRIDHAPLGIDCTGEIIALLRPLTGKGAGSLRLTVEEL